MNPINYNVAPNINVNIPQDLPFYKVLGLLEKKKGLTEREVIERLEVPRSTYRSWKDGTCEPSRRTQWRKLSQVFGINTEILIFEGRTKMGILKTAIDILLIVLGLAVAADSTSFLMKYVTNHAIKEAHPQNYISLKQWTRALVTGRM